ncbi:PhnD/SsuA/transferrin family substrate-binding protein [Paenibacillus sp. P26]|nr:PhnD/SsuA/transferrin family substrate-binding protein [Paenibacillus sp. P26]
MLRFQTARRSLLSLFLVFTIGLASGRGTTSGGQKPSGDAAPEAKTAGASGSASVDLGKVTLRVGQTGWGSYELGLKAAGLDKTPYKVQYHVFQGGNLQLEAMAANNLDFGSASEIPPIFASLAANGGNFKVIAANVASTLNQELVVPKGSPIQSVAELKGKKVAYVTNTTAHYFLVKMLQQAGLSWNDIEALRLVHLGWTKRTDQRQGGCPRQLRERNHLRSPERGEGAGQRQGHSLRQFLVCSHAGSH